MCSIDESTCASWQRARYETGNSIFVNTQNGNLVFCVINYFVRILLLATDVMCCFDTHIKNLLIRIFERWAYTLLQVQHKWVAQEIVDSFFFLSSSTGRTQHTTEISCAYDDGLGIFLRGRGVIGNSTVSEIIHQWRMKKYKGQNNAWKLKHASTTADVQLQDYISNKSVQYINFTCLKILQMRMIV